MRTIILGIVAIILALALYSGITKIRYEDNLEARVQNLENCVSNLTIYAMSVNDAFRKSDVVDMVLIKEVTNLKTNNWNKVEESSK